MYTISIPQIFKIFKSNAQSDDNLVDLKDMNIGDLIINHRLNIVARIESFCDDPYAFDNADVVAYVRYFDLDTMSYTTDHWHYEDCERYVSAQQYINAIAA